MAIDRVWIGGTSADPETDANWDPAGPLVTLDNLIFNDQAQQLCNGQNLGAITVTIQVEESFPYTIGSSGDPLIVDGINYLRFMGTAAGASYITTDTTDTDLCVLDSPSTANPVLVLNGTVKSISIRRGRMALASTAVASQRADVVASAGGLTAELTIPAGVTTTGLIVFVKGGKAIISATVPDVEVKSGEVVLSGTAGVTGRVEQSGGQFWWDAQSTIALAEVSGGKFGFRNSRRTRTLTAGILSGDGEMDFSIGGLKDSLFTNGILLLGENMPKVPRGAVLTISSNSSGFAR